MNSGRDGTRVIVLHLILCTYTEGALLRVSRGPAKK